MLSNTGSELDNSGPGLNAAYLPLAISPLTPTRKLEALSPKSNSRSRKRKEPLKTNRILGKTRTAHRVNMKAREAQHNKDKHMYICIYMSVTMCATVICSGIKKRGKHHCIKCTPCGRYTFIYRLVPAVSPPHYVYGWNGVCVCVP